MAELLHRKSIDWKKTGKNLLYLRNDDLTLRRNVCSALRREDGNCSGDCAVCKYDMDNSISRPELASVFHVSESVIFNWENGKTPVSLEDMLFYCQIAGKKLKDLVVFDEDNAS